MLLIKEYGENMRVKFKANSRLTNGEETNNSHSTSESLLHNKPKPTKKIAFQLDTSDVKNGDLER